MNQPPLRPGRPRSADLDAQIVEAVFAIVAEAGYAALSMEGIASRASVGKASLYRRFKSRGEVAAHALLARYSIAPRQDEEKQGAVERHLGRIFEAVNGPAGPVLRGLMADAQLDGNFATLFRERFILARRDALKAAILLEFAHPRDVDLALDIALGTLWYRLLVGHAPLTADLAGDLAGIVRRLVNR